MTKKMNKSFKKITAIFLSSLLLASTIIVNDLSATTFDIEEEHELLLRDGVGDPITTQQTFRFSLWSDGRVDSGDISSGTINVGASSYGGYQQTVNATPDSTGTIDFFVYDLAGFPTQLDDSNQFIQIEYKAFGQPDTSYQIFDLSFDSSDHVERRLLRRNTQSSTYTYNAGGETTHQTFILDSDNTGGDIKLQFGNSLDKSILWDSGNTRFTFDDDIRIEGNQAIVGQNFIADDHAATDSDGIVNIGRNNNGWESIRWDDTTGQFQLSPETLTLDSDDTTGDLTLQFGKTLGKTLTWDESETAFAFNDDLQITGDLDLTGQVNNLQISSDGTIITLDADNAASGNNIRLIANQGSDSDAEIRYNASTNQWEVSNDGGAFSAIGQLSDLATVQARRSTTLSVSTSFSDITFDQTDVESNASTLEHDNSNTDRINIKKDGYYLISYDISLDASLLSTSTVQGRVRLNDTSTLNGSTGQTTSNTTLDQELSQSFIAQLNTNDFISLQVERSGGSVSSLSNAIFTITKLDGVATTSNIFSGTNNNTFVLDQDDTGGDVTLQFGQTLNEDLNWDSSNNRFSFSDDLKVQGNIALDGNNLFLDDDNSGSGADINIIANQGSDSDGIIRYNSTTNQWELSNDAGSFAKISTYEPLVAQAYESGTTTFNAATPIDWDGSSANSRIIDSVFSHSTSVNPSRITINQDGLYQVSYNVSWDTTANARRTAQCDFYINGAIASPAIGASHGYARNNTDDFESNSATFFYRFTAGDYYQIQCSSTGTAGSITTLANQSWTAIQYIKP